MEKTVHYKFRIIALLLTILTIGAVIYMYLSASEDTSTIEPPVQLPIATSTVQDQPVPLPETFGLADGFKVEIFAEGLMDPHDMLLDDRGQLIVTQFEAGSVVVLSDDDKDGVVDRNTEVLWDIDKPSGLLLDCGVAGCWLYVAQNGALWRYLYDAEVPRAFRGEEMALLPEGGLHTYHALLSQDEDVYVSVGASCDVCIEEDPLRATVLKTDFDGDVAKEYASGLRNVMDMAAHPITKQIFVVEDGRDGISKKLPPDEINLLEENTNFGWPICFGKNQHDRFFDNNNYIRNPCEEPFQAESFIDLAPHVTPTSLAFIPENGWPKEYRGELLIATRGDEEFGTASPSILRVRDLYSTSSNRVVDFASGWNHLSEASSSPAQLLFDDAGVLYVSDSMAGVIYRLWYADVIPDQIDTSKPVLNPIAECRPTGCSSEICSDQPLDSACIYLPEYACLREAVCERQPSGDCGWTHTNSFQACLEEVDSLE